jgi:hypothetical protein
VTQRPRRDHYPDQGTGNAIQSRSRCLLQPAEHHIEPALHLTRRASLGEAKHTVSQRRVFCIGCPTKLTGHKIPGEYNDRPMIALRRPPLNSLPRVYEPRIARAAVYVWRHNNQLMLGKILIE